MYLLPRLQVPRTKCCFRRCLLELELRIMIAPAPLQALSSYAASYGWGPLLSFSRSTLLSLLSRIETGSLSVTDVDGKSMTNFSESESYVHASQITSDPNGNGEKPDVAPQPKRSKAQMWNDIKITCEYSHE